MELKPLDYYNAKYDEVNSEYLAAAEKGDFPLFNKLGKLLSKVEALITLALLRERDENKFSLLIQGVNPKLIAEV